MEGALAHARAIVAAHDVVIGLAPAQRLCRRQHGLLHLLVVVADFPMLAPSRLIFAFGAVVGSVLDLVVHLEDVVEASRVRLCRGDLRVCGCGGFGLPEVVDVGVSLIQFILQLLDAPHRGIPCLSCLFLYVNKSKRYRID